MTHHTPCTDFDKKKILVIDDNISILFIMREALELQTYEVHTSESFTGLELIERVAPNMIFLDILLAAQDGRDVSKTIKAASHLAHIPIVILTANTNARNLAHEAEADDYMSKPFELSTLWDMAKKYTNRLSTQ